MNFLWFRNDLRLKFNKTLEIASGQNKPIIPIFILDDRLLRVSRAPDVRINFLYSSISDIQKSLKRIGSDLLIYQGNPAIFWQKVSSHESVQIYASKDYSSFSTKRDFEVSSKIATNSTLTLFKNLVVFDNEDNFLNKEGNPYKIFTSFKTKWIEKLAQDKEILIFKLKHNFASVEQIELVKGKIRLLTGLSPVTVEDLVSANITGGEANARKIWLDFKKDKIFDYSKNRNNLNIEGTSKLSPYLKFGCISPHEIILDCLEIIKRNNEDLVDFRSLQDGKLSGVETFLSEIIWREFYKYILSSFPFVEKEAFQVKFRQIRWINNEVKFKAWCEGKTGYPIIDACMRMLSNEAWMHNRGRMIVGSFLCKDLHIDWKWGEKYFKEKLIDYDLSANNGGWQWVAGVGTDAAPYFRIFNPIEQSKKFDPEGSFIKKYIPELSKVPVKFIHEPWKMPENLQKEIRIKIGKDYPLPIVDHSEARKIALDIYSI